MITTVPTRGATVLARNWRLADQSRKITSDAACRGAMTIVSRFIEKNTVKMIPKIIRRGPVDVSNRNEIM
jgi:hypothetical protein